MIILGIDPGLNNTGWGVVRYVNQTFNYIASGTIVNPGATDIGLKLKNIYDALFEVIKQQCPSECAIEDTFVNLNPRLSLKLGCAKGIALLAVAQNHLKITEYSPRTIKSAFTGSGKADKAQMTSMLKYLLPQHKASTEHEVDALAIAICHINMETFSRKQL